MTERRVKIHYRRPPDREEVFDQLLVLERDDVTVTLVETMDFDLPMRISNEVALEQGSSVVWFTFPNAWHDIGRFHRADGAFTGFYANVITPVDLSDDVWHTTDLYLDVWLAPGREAQLLDEEEFDEAVGRGLIDADTATRAREEAAHLLEAAKNGQWPPQVVREWTLERALAAKAG